MVQSLTYPSAPMTRNFVPAVRHHLVPPATRPRRQKGHFVTRSPIAYDRLSILVDHFQRAWDDFPETTAARPPR
jgi:hypothetical protein